jgi:hypothetical protein
MTMVKAIPKSQLKICNPIKTFDIKDVQALAKTVEFLSSMT